MLEERELRAIARLRARSREPHPRPFAEWRRARPADRAACRSCARLLDLDRAPPRSPSTRTPPPPTPPATAPGAARRRAARAASTADRRVRAPTQIRLGVTDDDAQAEPVHLPLEQVKTPRRVPRRHRQRQDHGRAVASSSSCSSAASRCCSSIARATSRATRATRGGRAADDPIATRRRRSRARDRRRAVHAGQRAGPAAAPAADPDAVGRHDAGARPARRVRRERPRRDDGLRHGRDLPAQAVGPAVRDPAPRRGRATSRSTLLRDTINRPDPELLRDGRAAAAATSRRSPRISRPSTSSAARCSPATARRSTSARCCRRPASARGCRSSTPSALDRDRGAAVLGLAPAGRARRGSRASARAKTLQAVAFFDEADAYVPAIGQPADQGADVRSAAPRALRRASACCSRPRTPATSTTRRATTSAPGSSARSRRTARSRRCATCSARYPNVAPRLATQPTGHFFVLAAGERREIKCDRSLMQHRAARRARGHGAGAPGLTAT